MRSETILIIDKDPDRSSAVMSVLTLQRFRVVAVGDWREALRVYDHGHPALVIVTWYDRAEILMTELKLRHPGIAIIVLMEELSVAETVTAMKAGAAHVYSLPLDVAEMRQIILRILHRHEKHREIIETARSLTPREIEVAHLLLRCNTNKEVARLLGISPRTVEVYRAHLLQKLGIRSLVELYQVFSQAFPNEVARIDIDSEANRF